MTKVIIVTDKLISVVVPIYNTEKYLTKCFDSILNQTHKNIELILVDDGSTDGSGTICDEYAIKDNRVKVIHQQNGGPVKARREGLEIAEGEYIGFVDSDDWIEPNMYEEMLDNLLETGADFVHTGYVIEKDSKIVNEDCHFKTEVINYPRNNFRIMKALMWDRKDEKIHGGFYLNLYKADLIKKSFEVVPDDMYYFEDHASTLECFFLCKRVSLLKKSFYHYVVRKESLVHSDESRMKFMVKTAYAYEQIAKIFTIHDQYEKMKPYLNTFFVKRMFSVIRNTKLYNIIFYKLDFTERLADRKIVVYGAGAVGYDYYRQLKHEPRCQVVNWVDKNFSKYHYKEGKVNPVENLQSADYDLILIAIKDEEVAKQIIDNLVEMGVDREKCYWQRPVYLLDLIDMN